MDIFIKNSKVTFLKKAPKSATEIVSDYANIVTLTSTEQTALVTFVQTLINNEVWDKIKAVFPMVGGLDSYYKDLKRAEVNSFRSNEVVSYDKNHTSLYVDTTNSTSYYPHVGTVVDGDIDHMSVILSAKVLKQDGNASIIQLNSDYSELIAGISRKTNLAGTDWVTRWTFDKDFGNSVDFKVSYYAESNYINCLTINDLNVTSYNKSGDDNISKTTDTFAMKFSTKTGYTHIPVWIGGYYNSMQCFYKCLIYADYLTEDEVGIVINAVKALNVALGRDNW